MASTIIHFLPTAKITFDYSYGDDVVDRIHSLYTVIMLAFFSLVIFAKSYVGEPLQCFVPAEFTPYWEQYSEQYCLVENTYFVPLNSSIPDDHQTREQLEINYYQWVPFMLAIQAALFLIPHYLWAMIYSSASMSVGKLVNLARDAQGKVDRTADIQLICKHVEDSCELSTNSRNATKKSFNRYFVIVGYIFIKVLLLANVVGQIFLLNTFLGTTYTFWGAEVLQDLQKDTDWQDSGHFPRVTVCDFDVRVLGNVHRYSVQCVLMVNMFSEKIFIFIWWWFVVLASVTIINLVYWICLSIFGGQQTGFVSQYITTAATTSDKQRAQIRDFTKLLGADGMFALHLISNNAGEMVTRDVVRTMWDEYTKEGSQRGFTSSPFAPWVNSKYDA